MGTCIPQVQNKKKQRYKYYPPLKGSILPQGDKPDPRNSQIVQKHFQLTPQAQITYQKIKHQIDDNIPSTIYQLYDPKATYQGQFKNRWPHGYGIAFFQNQSFYAGEFNEGDADSDLGIFICPDGSIYRGSFKKSLFEGYGGKQNFRKNKKYVGQWKQGRPDGLGQEIIYKNRILLNSGIKKIDHGQDFGQILMYTGQYKNGKKNGYGKLKTTTGLYEGIFSRGNLNQYGVFMWQNNQKAYIGNFFKSKPIGQGKIIYHDKVQHVNWKDNKKQVAYVDKNQYSYLQLRKIKERHSQQFINSKEQWNKVLNIQQQKQNIQIQLPEQEEEKLDDDDNQQAGTNIMKLLGFLPRQQQKIKQQIKDNQERTLHLS